MGITKIEWTASVADDGTITPGYTFNPWLGCQKVSPGCDHCYAEAMMDHRWGKVQWGPHGERKRTSEANWRKPRQWAKAARETGTRPRVFCASLADVFDNQVPREWRNDLFALIEDIPELDWLLLTKRPENIADMLWQKWQLRLPQNIWLGATAEDQAHYERRWPILRAIPAAIHFISYEPALGPLAYLGLDAPDWLICGGESGRGARPMPALWARTARAICAYDGVAFFMKQMSGKAPIPADLLVRQFPRVAA